MRAKRPPVVEGTLPPRRRDYVRMAWWQTKAPWIMAYGAHKLAEDRRVTYLYGGLILAAAVSVFGLCLSSGKDVASAVLWALVGAFAFPVVVFGLLVAVIGRPVSSRRWYMTPSRDAAMAVAIITERRRIGKRVRETHTWTISNHAVQRIGGAAGEELRAALIGPLVRAVDADDDAATLHAASEQHARLYRIAVDGLIDVGPARPRGRKMYRPRRSDRERLARAVS